jgi:predicted nucleic acid-binding protein
MKGLDTPVLLEILHGTPRGRRLLKSLQGEELATTELNMFELYHVASQGPKPARPARQKALVALRRRISVLPITSGAADEVSRGGSSRPLAGGYGPLVWAALTAAGCGEWFTTRAAAPPKGATKLKVRII